MNDEAATTNPELDVLLNKVEALAGKRVDKADRPLFKDELEAWRLYRSRLPAYRASDLRVDVAPGETEDEVAARVALLVACDT